MDGPSILKDDIVNRIIHFHINSPRIMGPAKQNKLHIYSIEINKPLPAIVYSILRVTFKLRNQF